jgi:hypothetical protein
LVRFPTQQQAQPLQPVVVRTLQHTAAGMHGSSQQHDSSSSKLPAVQSGWGISQQQHPAAAAAAAVPPWGSRHVMNAAHASTAAVAEEGVSAAGLGHGLTAGRRAAALLRSLQGEAAPSTAQQQQHAAPWQQVVQASSATFVHVSEQQLHQQQQDANSAAGPQVEVMTALDGAAAITSQAGNADTAAAAAAGAAPSAADQLQQQPQQLPLTHHGVTPLGHHRQRLQQRQPASASSPAKSPSRSPRKSAVNKKWVLLQQLKARNRSKRHATAGADAAAQPQGMTAISDGSIAHLSLLQQLQGLMRQPAGPAAAGAADVVQAAAAGQQQVGAAARPDLDAAAATALQGVLWQLLLVRQQQAPLQAAVRVQQQQKQQMVAPADTAPGSEATTASATQPGMAVEPGSSNTSCAIQTEPSLLGMQQPQQPLLLPRMLSRAPLLDAEVQAGGLGPAQRQQLMAAATQTAASAAPDPVQVVLRVTNGQPAGQQPEQHPSMQLQSLQQQQQHAPLSPAALVALAAAAGAGAASAMNTAGLSPHKQSGRAAQSQQAAEVATAAPHEHGVVELAQLILGAFEQQGGVIQPDSAALTAGSRAICGSSTAPQQQHQLLPNPLAGPAAPQFLQVVDLQDAPPTQPWQLQQQPQQLWQQQPWQQQQQSVQQEWQWNQQQHPQHVMASTADGHLNMGCCFASCPERVASPTFKGCPPPAASSSIRATSARTLTRQQQHKAGSSSRDVSRPRDVSNRHSSSAMKPAAASKAKQPKRTSSADSKHSGASATGSRSHQQQQQQQSSAVHSSSVYADVRASRSFSAAGRSSPLNEWRQAQTQQLDQLWQQWQQQQQAQVQQKQQQQDAAAAAAAPQWQPPQKQQHSKENLDPNMQKSTAGPAAGRLPAASYNHTEEQPLQDDELAGGDSASAVSSLSRAAARAAAKKLAEAEQQLNQQHLEQQVRGTATTAAGNALVSTLYSVGF